ncbi:VWA domain-containing protein [Halorubellus sp. PRR65]|uniref:VWA domain-containing protein n=1 Tax=Halorubellus sp. PRR65 TaxID=3098148 RepID=UPI002B25D216|nr:VWA domain-containing protein [Halorubellus sp. PRR65]
MVDYGGGKKVSPDPRRALSFGEIVGQADLKQALLAVAANDALDGLLVRGEKGTAKSTAVRALAALLPEQHAVADCPYGCPPDDPRAQCETCRGRDDPPTETRSVPLVTLPLGASRERVVGTLSVADALAGDHEFDPGLLARANRGILYVDEVNLLDDHLVDVLLDAAASGTNRVERDGVSVAHPARFTLVGTMNPEEGELRPQLRDRFALQATVEGCQDLDDRVAVIDRALDRPTRDASTTAPAPDADTLDLATASTATVRERLRDARERLPRVELPTEYARDVAALCRDAGVDGHRGDIATARAARTVAALDERTTVAEPDLERAAALALPHRLQSRPFEDAPDPDDLLDEHFADDADDGDGDGQRGDDDGDRGDDGDGGPGDRSDGERGGDGERGADDAGDEAGGSESEPAGSESVGDSGTTDAAGATADGEGGEAPDAETGDDGDADDGSGDDADGDGGGGDAAERIDGAPAAGATPGASDDSDQDGVPAMLGQASADVGAARAPELDVPDAGDPSRPGSGSRSGSRSSSRSSTDGDGARVRSRPADGTTGVDAAASVRAAAARGADGVESRDLRASVRSSDASALVVFVVDASASMRPAMRAAKGTVLELLQDAYQARDEVAFVAFAGDDASVLLPPTDSVTLAARHLKDLPTGDRTPLPAGLRTAGDVLERAAPAASVVVLVSDGRANVADGSPTRETRDAAARLRAAGSHVVVVDAGSDGERAALTTAIAEETDGERVPLDALTAERVDAAVGDALDER